MAYQISNDHEQIKLLATNPINPIADQAIAAQVKEGESIDYYKGMLDLAGMIHISGNSSNDQLMASMGLNLAIFMAKRLRDMMFPEEFDPEIVRSIDELCDSLEKQFAEDEDYNEEQGVDHRRDTGISDESILRTWCGGSTEDLPSIPKTGKGQESRDDQDQKESDPKILDQNGAT